MIRRVAAVTLALMAVLALTGPASPAYADSSNNAAADRLAQMYSPIVVVRTQSSPCGAGEPYLPTSVGTVLGRTDVVLRGPGGQSIAAPTSADLAGKGEGWYLDLPGNPLDPGCSYEKWFHSVASGAPSTVYARVTTDSDHPGIVVLQYWFFWVFNDWNDKHEGDWEMIQLLFDAPDAEAALAKAPARVAFAQHEGSEVAVWSDPKLHTEGTHVAVYPGAGSHAAYYTQAQWFGKSAAAGFGCDNTSCCRRLRPRASNGSPSPGVGARRLRRSTTVRPAPTPRPSGRIPSPGRTSKAAPMLCPCRSREVRR